VVDREAMHRAIEAMGFRPTTRLFSSHRRTRIGNVAVLVDEVAGHGTFLTLVRDCPDDVPVEVLHAGLADLAASLGVHGHRVHGRFGRCTSPARTGDSHRNPWVTPHPG
jgi:adenylate cyclase class 2